MSLPAKPRTWLRATAAAAHIGLTVPAVYRLVSRGALPAYRATDKGALLFCEAELDAWIESRRVAPVPEHRLHRTPVMPSVDLIIPTNGRYR